ncbi:MAG: RnfABCDGE type electron transport complex subunit D, partial [Rudaea sp.]
MIEFVDAKLNGITMYRLVLYYLISLFAVAVLLSFAGVLAYDPFALLFSLGWLIAVSWTTNAIFSKAFAVPANAESVYITALILALIITPIQSPNDLWFLGWAGVLAMASKYIVALNNKHLFNPAAFAVAVTYLAINQSASWWVGSGAMLPFVLLGGVLVVRKLQRADLVSTFLIVSAGTVFAFTLLNGESFAAALQQVVLSSPLFFFAFIILTEPLTPPPARWPRIAYGVLVGLLFAPQFHIGPIYTTPELAILIGNVFSYLVSPKRRLILQLARKVRIAPDVYDFIFASPYKPAFAPGQYMEWTLGMQDPDSRGNRRYFTLASSPTEKNVRLGIKFYPESSAFKETLLSMPE